jgi:hypothetical protein
LRDLPFLGLQFQLQSLGSPSLSPNNTTSTYQQQQSQQQQHGRAMASSAASAKEDEVTSSEEAKAFSENENNAEVKGQSLWANINSVSLPGHNSLVTYFGIS